MTEEEAACPEVHIQARNVAIQTGSTSHKGEIKSPALGETQSMKSGNLTSRRKLALPVGIFLKLTISQMTNLILIVMIVSALMKVLWTSAMMIMMMKMMVISSQDHRLQNEEVMEPGLLRHPTIAVEVVQVGMMGKVTVGLRILILIKMVICLEMIRTDEEEVTLGTTLKKAILMIVILMNGALAPDNFCQLVEDTTLETVIVVEVLGKGEVLEVVSNHLRRADAPPKAAEAAVVEEAAKRWLKSLLMKMQVLQVRTWSTLKLLSLR
jgi:hypothetical protein